MIPRTQRGYMLIWVLIAFVIVTAVVFAGGAKVQANQTEALVRFRSEGQASDVARAGLVDAFAWFRRQTTQPVTTFAPQRDMLASPAINETNDPTIGLVREYEITPGVWGRYEVRLFSDAERQRLLGPGRGRGRRHSGALPHGRRHGVAAGGARLRVSPYRPRHRVEHRPELPHRGRRRGDRNPPDQPPPAGSVGALCVSRGDRATISSQARVDGSGTAAASCTRTRRALR